MMTPFEILYKVSDVTPDSVISRLSSFLPEDVLFIHWAIDDTQEVQSWKNHVRNQRRHFSFGTQLRFQLVSDSITMLQHEWKILHGFPSMIVKDAQLSQRISRPKMNFNMIKIFLKEDYTRLEPAKRQHSRGAISRSVPISGLAGPWLSCALPLPLRKCQKWWLAA